MPLGNSAACGGLRRQMGATCGLNVNVLSTVKEQSPVRHKRRQGFEGL